MTTIRGQLDRFFLTVDGDPDSARIEINDHPMPFAVRYRRVVYQLGRSAPFVHQEPNFTLEQLDPEVIGVRRLHGVVEQQTDLSAGLQLELPSAKSGQRKLEGSRGTESNTEDARETRTTELGRVENMLPS